MLDDVQGGLSFYNPIEHFLQQQILIFFLILFEWSLLYYIVFLI